MTNRYLGSSQEQIDLLSLPREEDSYLEKSRKFCLWLDSERGCDHIHVASMKEFEDEPVK